MTETDLHTRHGDAIDRLSHLRQQRGAALLDGLPIDDIQIAQIEAEIDALEAAETEAVRRSRQAEAARLEALKSILIAEAKDKEAARLSLIAEAEKHARGFALVMKDIMSITAAERGCFARMGSTVPTALADEPMQRRLGERLSAALSQFSQYPSRLGTSVSWQSVPSWIDPSAPWAEAERQELSSVFSNLEEA